MTEETTNHDGDNVAPEQETAGGAPLDERVAKPVLQGEKGVETAQVWVCAFLIIIAGGIAYASIFGIPFHADDQRLIRDNTALHALTTFPNALDPQSPQPLTMLTYALNWAISPHSSAAFHAVNLLLHLLNGILLYLLCRRLFAGKVPEAVAMLAGLVLLVHPLNTESVNYIVGRAGLLATSFSLASLLLFLRATTCQRHDLGEETPSTMDDPNARAGLRAGPLALSVLAFMVAWTCEETAIILPAILLALDYVVHGKRSFGRRLLMHSPYWAMLLVLVAVRVAATPQTLSADAFPLHRPDAGALLGYLRMTVAPYGLSVDHTTAGSSGALAFGAIAGLLILAVFLVWKRSLAGFALFWYAVSIVCASVREPMLVERHAYLALAGVAILVPWFFSVLTGPPLFAPLPRMLAGIAVAALLLAAGAATYIRTMDWQGEILLWSDAAQKAPESPRPPRYLGRALLATERDVPGQAEVAVNQLRRAVELAPNGQETETRVDLGIALQRTGRLDEALHTWRRALESDLDNPRCTVLLADALAEKAGRTGHRNDLLRALDYYRRAERFGPLEGPSLKRYASALVQIGAIEEAEPLLARAVGTDQAAPLATLLDNVRATLKRVKEMEQEAAALLRKDPSDPAALKIRARVHMLRGQPLEAAYILDVLLRQGTEDFAVWVLMGYAQAMMDGAEGFIEEWPTPPPRPDDVDSAWKELARTCAAHGLWDAAQRYLESRPGGAEAGSTALIVLAELALELQQGQRANDYLRRATEADRSDPTPWLRLCDRALSANDPATARRYLSEAETRGAAPDELAKREERLGGGESKPDTPVQTIME